MARVICNPECSYCGTTLNLQSEYCSGCKMTQQEAANAVIESNSDFFLVSDTNELIDKVEASTQEQAAIQFKMKGFNILLNHVMSEQDIIDEIALNSFELNSD